MRVAALAPLILALSLPVATAGGQEPVEADVKGEARVVEASGLRVEALLEEWQEAEESGDALAVAAVLAEMAAHSNEDFVKPGLDGLKYRASRADRKAAEQEVAAMGLEGKEAELARVLEREVAVHAAAATLLGSAKGDRNAKALRKRLGDEEYREGRGEAVRAIIDALGRLDDHDAEDLVREVLETWGDARVSQACVLYFGKVRTKSYEHVRYLCTLLKAPAPEWVDDPNNPPAEYWEKRWKIWQLLRRDVTWTLQQVTGQAFLAQEGDRPADTERALQWIEEHRQELGLE
jgi:hypothetical protein